MESYQQHFQEPGGGSKSVKNLPHQLRLQTIVIMTESKWYNYIFEKSESKKTFTIGIDALKFYNYDLKWIGEPGDFEVMIVTNCDQINKRSFKLLKKINLSENLNRHPEGNCLLPIFKKGHKKTTPEYT